MIWRPGGPPRGGRAPGRRGRGMARGAREVHFRGLALGWINADFRVQIRILQHFSRRTRKSPSRKRICKCFANSYKSLKKKEEEILKKKILLNFRQSLAKSFGF